MCSRIKWRRSKNLHNSHISMPHTYQFMLLLGSEKKFIKKALHTVSSIALPVVYNNFISIHIICLFVRYSIHFYAFFVVEKKIRFQEKPKKPSKWKKPKNNNSSKKKREQTNEWIATKRQIVKPKPLWLANVHIYIFHLFVLYVRFVFFAFNVCLLLYVCIRMPMHRAKAMAPRAPNVYCVVYDCAFVWNSKSNIRNVTVHFNSNTMCFTYLTVRIFALNYISFFSCISFPILSHAHVHRRFSPCSILFTWCVS